MPSKAQKLEKKKGQEGGKAPNGAGSEREKDMDMPARRRKSKKGRKSSQWSGVRIGERHEDATKA